MKLNSVLVTIALLASSAASIAVKTPRFISGWGPDSVDQTEDAAAKERRSVSPRFIMGWGSTDSIEDDTEDA
ncbi:hypothetical protein GGR54DRAFT_636763 [Hypoxylon sp. NC1633]|nr:hypothetical protein GGR54DRAFT_636763 [Hypoxylon sp. NC1633]